MNIVTIDKAVDPDIFLILLIFLAIDTMRQGPDNYNNFVKIQIFLKLALGSVRGLLPAKGRRYV